MTKQLIRKSNGDTIPGSMVETVSWREIRAVEIPREDYRLLCEREMEAARKIRLNSKSDNLGGPAIRCYDSRHMARGMLEMYVGRIVAVGCNQKGDPVAAYRVSSRSFPNRSAEQVGDTVRIVAHAGSADAVSDSPYIAYECLVWNSRFAVVSNGTHTRPIYERLKAGNNPRDAIVNVLVGLDREFDQHDTPRICGLVDLAENKLWLGGITATSLSVMPVEVQPGRLAYITTYGFPLPRVEQIDIDFDAIDPASTCSHMINGSVFSQFEKPVCAASWIASASGPKIATLNSVGCG